ncbi:membrane protein [Philodulcilactobacillus myokoensis]|uniref:Membrane protein n=1 Tax=Philodulcilactobacillus myokoensis TaxID=2929573 RepID=A0A9W6ES47_9LACO|nr:TMEM175 family protein [Philodulcilactobacillus myokoensis]GLB46177.1 membrane protein [Philodulcilactobacillus myokoensis]
MNKSRIEAFTDAVIAIILTIMLLELKVPKSLHFSAIFQQLPYIFSYSVGYLYIGITWYNHHYMFSKAHWISNRIFAYNLLWMFITSFIPLATAWVGEGINARGPALFYAFIYLIWTISYMLLSHSIIESEIYLNHMNSAHSIQTMKTYRNLTNPKFVVIALIIWALILIFIPAVQLVAITIFVLAFGTSTNDDGDKMFKN